MGISPDFRALVSSLNLVLGHKHQNPKHKGHMRKGYWGFGGPQKAGGPVWKAGRTQAL